VSPLVRTLIPLYLALIPHRLRVGYPFCGSGLFAGFAIAPGFHHRSFHHAHFAHGSFHHRPEAPKPMMGFIRVQAASSF
jgi:hypothetical protein